MTESPKYKEMHDKLVQDGFWIYDHMPHKGITVMAKRVDNAIMLRSIKFSGEVVRGNLLRGQ